jgi:hypothetical protein
MYRRRNNHLYIEKEIDYNKRYITNIIFKISSLVLD